MKVDLPTPIVQACIDSRIIQETGSTMSAESRGAQVERLTYHVGDYVCSLVGKLTKGRLLR